jgi:hypothetical protein
MILSPCCLAWNTAQSIVAKASSFTTPSVGMMLSGFPVLTPNVWLRMVFAPIVTSVFITSVMRPRLG